MLQIKRLIGWARFYGKNRQRLRAGLDTGLAKLAWTGPLPVGCLDVVRFEPWRGCLARMSGVRRSQPSCLVLITAYKRLLPCPLLTFPLSYPLPPPSLVGVSLEVEKSQDRLHGEEGCLHYYFLFPLFIDLKKYWSEIWFSKDEQNLFLFSWFAWSIILARHSCKWIEVAPRQVRSLGN